MTETQRAAMRQALEVLEWVEPSGLTGRGGFDARSNAITALRAALAEPEPVAVADPFADIRGKRMGELNDEQADRARELWLREQIGPQERYWYQQLEALFRIIDRLRAVPAEPEPEPVAWIYHGIRHDGTPHDNPSLIWRPEYMDVMSASKGAKATPLYTTPPARRPLTPAQEAAPELLEALQDLCDTLGECGMTEKARAAIDAAREAK